jgi:hypothetical protein
LGVALDNIEDGYDKLERVMLERFYDYVRSHMDYKWLHWNMRDSMYGFPAIAHRYRVLGGAPVELLESNLLDLSRLFYRIYGENYAKHPRLEYLMRKNGISDKDFLTGKEEACAFERKEYVRLHYSTVRKTEVIAGLARRHDQDTLSTDATWREQHAYSLQAVAEWLNQHWFAQLTLWVFAFVGVVASVIQIWQATHPNP